MSSAQTAPQNASERRTAQPVLLERVHTLGRWARLGLAFAGGALMTAGHPPIGFPWTLFVAIPLLMALAQSAPNGRAAAWTGWAAGFGYFTTGMHWLGHAFLVDAEKFAWLMPLGVLGLPAFLAIFWAVAFWAGRAIWRDPIASALGMAAIWTAVEYARGNILTGLPWNLPGYVWIDLAPMQWAAWIGPYGLTVLTLGLCAVPGLALASRRPATAGIALLLCLGVWLTGASRLPATMDPGDATTPMIRVVQPNIPQAEKWKPEHFADHYARLLKATAAPGNDGESRPDIILWPEAAIYLSDGNRAEYAASIANAAKGATVLLGALEQRADGVANALTVLSPDGTWGQSYAKHHLVPFGEYLPFGKLFDVLGLRQFAVAGNLLPGPGPQTMSVPGIPAFSPLICYEAIFPDQIVGATRPAWLVQPTNDAWFGGFAGPQQHLAQARFRAVEQGLPLVRAANTGISAIIDPHGRVVASQDLHNYGYVDSRLPKALEDTTYSRYGDLVAFLIVAIFLFFALFWRFTGKGD